MQLPSIEIKKKKEFSEPLNPQQEQKLWGPRQKFFQML